MNPRVGASALAVADRIAGEAALIPGPTGSAAAAPLLVHHGHVGRLGDVCPPRGLSHPAVVRMVDRVGALDLVRRRTNPGGRREVGLSLTSEQRSRLGEAAESAPAGMAAEAVESGARICRLRDERACDLARCPVEPTVLTGGA